MQIACRPPMRRENIRLGSRGESRCSSMSFILMTGKLYSYPKPLKRSFTARGDDIVSLIRSVERLDV